MDLALAAGVFSWRRVLGKGEAHFRVVGRKIKLAPAASIATNLLLTSAVRANGRQVGKSFRDLLTDPGQCDILQTVPEWRGTECHSTS
jgi:hypothetical protein